MAHRMLSARSLARYLAGEIKAQRAKRARPAWDPKAKEAREILRLWPRGLSPKSSFHLQKALLDLHAAFLAWLDAEEAGLFASPAPPEGRAKALRNDLDLRFQELFKKDRVHLWDPERLDRGCWQNGTGGLVLKPSLSEDGKLLRVHVEGVRVSGGVHLLSPGARVAFVVHRDPGLGAAEALPSLGRDLPVPDSGDLDACWTVEGALAVPGVYRIDASQHGPVHAPTRAFVAEVDQALAKGKEGDLIGKLAAAHPDWSDWSPAALGSAEAGVGLERGGYLEALLKAEAYLQTGSSELRAFEDRMQPLAASAPEAVLLQGERVIDISPKEGGKPEDLTGVPEAWKALHAQALSALERWAAGMGNACGGFFPEARGAIDARTLRIWRYPSAVLLAQRLGELPEPESGLPRAICNQMTDGLLEPWARPLSRESLRYRLQVIQSLSGALGRTDPEALRGMLDRWGRGLSSGDPTGRELLLLRAAFLSWLESPESDSRRAEFDRRFQALWKEAPK